MAEQGGSMLSESEREEVRERTRRFLGAYGYTCGVREDVVESVLVMVEEWAAIGYRRALRQSRSR